MAKLIVTRADGTELGRKVTGLLGGRESWTITAAPIRGHAPRVQGLSLRFDAMDAVVGGYVQDDDATHVTPFALLVNRCVFYWTRPGAVDVTISAVVGGQKVQQTMSVRVLAPNVTEFTGTTASSSIAASVPRGREADAADETLSELKFQSDPEVPGIAFCAKVHLPQECSGARLFMQQTMKINRRKTHRDNSIEHDATTGFVLDQQVYYGCELDGDDGNFHTVGAGQSVLESEDSPGTTLGTSGKYRKFKRVDVDEDYCMYVMFQPRGGIAVALAQVAWKWQAAAVFDEDANAWRLEASPRNGEQSVLQQSRYCTRLPTWSANAEATVGPDH